MVRVAPSGSNRQAWRIVRGRSGKDFHLFMERTKKLSIRFVKSDTHRIDMGIAMCHFELAAKELGLKGAWIKKKPPDINTLAAWEYIASWN
jgi:nitroreductase